MCDRERDSVCVGERESVRERESPDESSSRGNNAQVDNKQSVSNLKSNSKVHDFLFFTPQRHPPQLLQKRAVWVFRPVPLLSHQWQAQRSSQWH